MENSLMDTITTVNDLVNDALDSTETSDPLQGNDALRTLDEAELNEREMVQELAEPAPPKPPEQWKVPKAMQKALETLQDGADAKPKRQKTLSLYAGLGGRHTTMVQLQADPPGGDVGLLPDNVEYKVEKDYIRRSLHHPEVLAHRALPQQLMYQYNKPSRKKITVNYRRPLPPIHSGGPSSISQEDAFFEQLKRRPSAVLLFPRHQSYERCGAKNGPCDVLGPAACARCIESTNRHLAAEIETVILPDVDVSSQSLVAPQLAHTLVKDNLRNITFTFSGRPPSVPRDTLLKRINTSRKSEPDLTTMTPQASASRKRRRQSSLKPPLLNLSQRATNTGYVRVQTLLSETSDSQGGKSAQVLKFD